MRKVTIIGGGGVRTPLVIYGLAQAQQLLQIERLTLYDVDEERVETIARLGREILRRSNSAFEIRVSARLEEAAEGADFVLNSIRVGGIAARARDERIAIEHDLAGQETTGPAGVAMALRTVPVTLQHARIVERAAPAAWFINFTNPAGLITQALQQHTGLRVIGICDTPIELFHKIAEAAGEAPGEMEFDYAGLNHLGWVRRVLLRGGDITERLLTDSEFLRRVYPTGLFDPELIRTLRLIPTEYLFFYYSQRKAHANQLRAGASRGEEIGRMNESLFHRLASGDAAQGLSVYRAYLLQRNASYMRLEAQAESAFEVAKEEYDPFETATGYHRIALDVMTSLVSDRSRSVVVNVRNNGAIEDLEPDDVVEVPCDIDRDGARPRRTGRLPDSIRGLVQSVKTYERTAIQAAVTGSGSLAQLAMLEYPIIGQWELAGSLKKSLIDGDPEHLGYLK
ncbi:MAG: glycoside hydrolase, family 4 [Candidatus Solibacter sp.]|nr:glycoside hydrolase, family 4 [Candidatus Solibacter sp.]